MSAALLLVLLVAAGIWMLLDHHDPKRDSTRRIIGRVDEILPQTQCQQCGYPGCLPYAEAIVTTGAPIDQCPPGGLLVHQSLAELLGRTGPSRHQAADSAVLRRLAVIDELVCIGCTKCLSACPVDAIIGAPKQVHTVVSIECTGCELCIAPCPVDCIDTVNATEGIEQWQWPPPAYSRLERRPATCT